MVSQPAIEYPSMDAERVRAALMQRTNEDQLELPLLPQVASQVMTMAGDERSSAARLSRLIHQDQALAGHVIRVANSAAFGGRTTIVSLQQAIARLGVQTLIEIAMSVSLKSRTFQVPGFQSQVKEFWRHSLGTALFAKEIARLRRTNVEIAFLCGLLHTIGKPVALQAIIQIQKELQLSLTFEQIEPVLDDLHVLVGGELAKKWSLPGQVMESIRWSSDYHQAPQFAHEAMTVCLAGRLATHVLFPEVLDDEALRQHPVAGDLNLYPDEVDRLLNFRDEVLPLVEALSI